MSKKIIGVDIGSYSFNASSGEIIIIGLDNLKLENILLITNVTDGKMLYNFADESLRATISNNIINLTYDTSLMSDSDSIQIFIEDGLVSNDTNIIAEKICDLGRCIVRLLNNVNAPPWLDKTLNRLRMTTLLESGTVTTVGSVTSVSNLSLLNSFQAQVLPISQNIASWSMCHRSKIS